MRSTRAWIIGLLLVGLGAVRAEGAHIVAVRQYSSEWNTHFTITFVGPCHVGLSVKTCHKVVQGAQTAYHWPAFPSGDGAPPWYGKGRHTITVAVPKRSDHKLRGYRVCLWGGYVARRNCRDGGGKPCEWCRKYGFHYVRRLATKNWGDTWGL